MDTSEQANTRAVEFIRSYAKEIIAWNPQGDWGKGYQEAIRYIFESLPEEK